MSLGGLDVGLDRLAELLENFLFLVGEAKLMRELVQHFDLDQTGSAFPVLAVERNADLVGLGEGKKRPGSPAGVLTVTAWEREGEAKVTLAMRNSPERFR